jgi:hypothetical protein
MAYNAQVGAMRRTRSMAIMLRMMTTQRHSSCTAIRRSASCIRSHSACTPNSIAIARTPTGRERRIGWLRFFSTAGPNPSSPSSAAPTNPPAAILPSEAAAEASQPLVKRAWHKLRGILHHYGLGTKLLWSNFKKYRKLTAK